MKKEDPWQYLAACIEFAEAIRSPSIEDYICRLPVHQDGTCNGLQHYAALGGDEVGAISVNVLPGSVPQDVYSEVLKLVVMSVEQVNSFILCYSLLLFFLFLFFLSFLFSF